MSRSSPEGANSLARGNHRDKDKEAQKSTNTTMVAAGLFHVRKWEGRVKGHEASDVSVMLLPTDLDWPFFIWTGPRTFERRGMMWAVLI